MIRFENVSLSFGGSPVLKDFSLSISSGEKVIFSGRSGIGKSSLFRLLLGFVRPDSGTILFMGKPLDSRTVREVRRSTAYISQDLNIGSGCVKEMFATIASFRFNSRTNYEHRKDELFKYFELEPGIIDKRISDLSGGEKQRTAIVQALLLGRNIFLLDEITSALDNKLKAKTMEYFFSGEGKTVLCISHDVLPECAEKACIINMEEYR